MDCSKSIELLSEFHDGTLKDSEQGTQVQTHLSTCQSCADVFVELDVIVLAARSLQREPGISFPDEETIWQRLNFAKGTVH